jgi:hypothetical protein
MRSSSSRNDRLARRKTIHESMMKPCFLTSC